MYSWTTLLKNQWARFTSLRVCIRLFWLSKLSHVHVHLYSNESPLIVFLFFVFGDRDVIWILSVHLYIAMKLQPHLLADVGSQWRPENQSCVHGTRDTNSKPASRNYRHRHVRVHQSHVMTVQIRTPIPCHGTRETNTNPASRYCSLVPMSKGKL